MFAFIEKIINKRKENGYREDEVKINQKISSIKKACPPLNHPHIFTDCPLLKNGGFNMLCDFSIYSDTFIGKRETQQDDYYLSCVTKINNKKRVFAVVCDGMGGMADGGKASRLTVKNMAYAYEKIHNDENIDFNRFLIEQTNLCDKYVRELKNGSEGIESGTTVTSIIIEDNRLYWCSVGDSRIYIKRDNNLYMITRDHNYYLILKSLIDKGAVTNQSAEENPQREALISYIGMGGLEIIDSNTIPYYLKDGDVILVCSDGVTKTLSKENILSCMYDKDAFSIVNNIMNNIKERDFKTQDNATFVVIKYSEN